MTFAKHIDSRTDSHQVMSLRSRLAALAVDMDRDPDSVLRPALRAQELARLNALSDRDLHALGLRRQDLVAHVFRDLLTS